MGRTSKRKRKALTMTCSIMLLQESEKRKRKARTWVKSWIRRRTEQGAYSNLVNELRLDDSASFYNLMRMDPGSFYYLLEKVSPIIQRQNTARRACISPEERLAVTLRFLATGESYVSLSYFYRIGSTTIGRIVPETCDTLYEVLMDDYMKMPNSEIVWKDIARGFFERWNFPNCIGAVDGKHIRIKPPANTGSSFYNYKSTFSIVLMAVVDSDYKFLYVDIGSNGRVSDGGVFRGCSFGKAMESRDLFIPPKAPLPGTDKEMPFMLIADDAFPLREDIMKPYANRGLTAAQRIFN